jgi:CubicO group peptidase (beta-lactamase class C family)
MDAARLERIEPVMRRYIDELGYAGISVLLARRGEIVFRASYGHADRDAAMPLTDDTIFRIYSLTKPIVSVAVITLLEEGRLRITDPLAKYLPAFAHAKVLTDSGELLDLERPIVIRDLLTHTAGFTNELQPTAAAAAYRRARLHFDATRTLAEFVDTVADCRWRSSRAHGGITPLVSTWPLVSPK